MFNRVARRTLGNQLLLLVLLFAATPSPALADAGWSGTASVSDPACNESVNRTLEEWGATACKAADKAKPGIVRVRSTPVATSAESPATDDSDAERCLTQVTQLLRSRSCSPESSLLIEWRREGRPEEPTKTASKPTKPTFLDYAGITIGAAKANVAKIRTLNCWKPVRSAVLCEAKPKGHEKSVTVVFVDNTLAHIDVKFKESLEMQHDDFVREHAPPNSIPTKDQSIKVPIGPKAGSYLNLTEWASVRNCDLSLMSIAASSQSPSSSFSILIRDSKRGDIVVDALVEYEELGHKLP